MIMETIIVNGFHLFSFVSEAAAFVKRLHLKLEATNLFVKYSQKTVLDHLNDINYTHIVWKRSDINLNCCPIFGWRSFVFDCYAVS